MKFYALAFLFSVVSALTCFADDGGDGANDPASRIYQTLEESRVKRRAEIEAREKAAAEKRQRDYQESLAKRRDDHFTKILSQITAHLVSYEALLEQGEISKDTILSDLAETIDHRIRYELAGGDREHFFNFLGRQYVEAIRSLKPSTEGDGAHRSPGKIEMGLEQVRLRQLQQIIPLAVIVHAEYLAKREVEKQFNEQTPPMRLRILRNRKWVENAIHGTSLIATIGVTTEFLILGFFEPGASMLQILANGAAGLAGIVAVGFGTLKTKTFYQGILKRAEERYEEKYGTERAVMFRALLKEYIPKVELIVDNTVMDHLGVSAGRSALAELWNPQSVCEAAVSPGPQVRVAAEEEATTETVNERKERASF